MVERVGGQSGLKVIVAVILTMLNACYLVGKIVTFESRFHKIPALYKENSTLHILYLSRITDKRVRGSIGVESGPLSEIGEVVAAMASTC
jgi:hypothetical protein